MPSSKKKILVVDNHPLILRFMREHLQRQGHDVVAAEDALSALSLLRDFRPEIIFVDLIMPKITGDQFCRILRSKPELEKTYLIVLSAIAAEEQTDFTAFGADACIAKGPLARMSGHIEEVLARIDAGTLRSHLEIIGLEGVYHRQITMELLSSKRRFESILAHIAEGILEISDRGQVIFANPVAQKILGIPEEGLLAAFLRDLFPGEQRERLAEILEGEPARGIVALSAVPFGEKFLDLIFLPTIDDDGSSTLMVIRDMTGSLRMRSALRDSEEKYRLLFQEMINGFALHDIVFDSADKPCDYRFLEVNAAFESIIGLKAAEVIGKTVGEVFPEDKAVLIPKYNSLGIGQHTRFGHFFGCSGRYFELTLFRSEKSRLAVVLNDLTDRKRLEEKLHAASITDELTGLLNRRGFITMSEQQLKLAAREGNSVSLVFADFDNLKKINDELGHKAGDQVLAATAAILRKTFRESDIIGRLGGDEFAILLIGASGADSEQPVLGRLAENMRKWKGSEIIGQSELSLTCGLARMDPKARCTLDELISRADQRMYEIKRKKKELN
ncbi:MAG: diguanylate cyclase [Desulfobacteraceae bacterium]|nr:diguanylate cyclase [Desulfobacteraceae bacterium]